MRDRNIEPNPTAELVSVCFPSFQYVSPILLIKLSKFWSPERTITCKKPKHIKFVDKKHVFHFWK